GIVAAFSLARPLDDRTPGLREAFRRQVRVDGRAIPGLVVVEGGSLGVGLGGCDTLGADPQSRQGDCPQHALDIGASLRIRRDTSVPPDRLHARVVGRERERQVATVEVDQISQVSDPALDVLAHVEDVADAKPCRRRRHELHQPTRALTRDRARLEVRLHKDDRLDQLGRERVSRCCRADQVAIRPCGSRGDGVIRWRRGFRHDRLRRLDVPDIEHTVTFLYANLGGSRRVHREDRGDDEAGSPYQKSRLILVEKSRAPICDRRPRPGYFENLEVASRAVLEHSYQLTARTCLRFRSRRVYWLWTLILPPPSTRGAVRMPF